MLAYTYSQKVYKDRFLSDVQIHRCSEPIFGDNCFYGN